jgi:hypothetical protein
LFERDGSQAMTYGPTHTLAILTMTMAAALCLPAAADAATRIYRTVDENGNVVFTDVPPRQGEVAEAVELSEGSSYQPAPAAEQAASGERPVRLEDWLGEEQDGEPEVQAYTSLRISAPANDASLRDNAGNVTVVADLAPELQAGHSLQLYLDGQLVQTTASGSTFQLANVDRGTHQVEVRVVSASGETLIASSPTTFHMQRRSVILQPNRSGG